MSSPRSLALAEAMDRLYSVAVAFLRGRSHAGGQLPPAPALLVRTKAVRDGDLMSLSERHAELGWLWEESVRKLRATYTEFGRAWMRELAADLHEAEQQLLEDPVVAIQRWRPVASR